MDNSKDMALALSDMGISDNIDIKFLKSRLEILNNAAAIVFDTCLASDVINFLLSNFGDKPIYVDPVSVGKAKALKPLIGKVHTLKMNKLEAEFLSDIKISDKSDLEIISLWFFS
jgi:pseudouridine kinase